MLRILFFLMMTVSNIGYAQYSGIWDGNDYFSKHNIGRYDNIVPLSLSSYQRIVEKDFRKIEYDTTSLIVQENRMVDSFYYFGFNEAICGQNNIFDSSRSYYYSYSSPYSNLFESGVQTVNTQGNRLFYIKKSMSDSITSFINKLSYHEDSNNVWKDSEIFITHNEDSLFRLKEYDIFGRLLNDTIEYKFHENYNNYSATKIFNNYYDGDRIIMTKGKNYKAQVFSDTISLTISYHYSDDSSNLIQSDTMVEESSQYSSITSKYYNIYYYTDGILDSVYSYDDFSDNLNEKTVFHYDMYGNVVNEAVYSYSADSPGIWNYQKENISSYNEENMLISTTIKTFLNTPDPYETDYDTVYHTTYTYNSFGNITDRITDVYRAVVIDSALSIYVYKRNHEHYTYENIEDSTIIDPKSMLAARVYPNPATNSITLRSENPFKSIEGMNLQIISLAGSSMLTRKVDADKYKVYLDTLPNGIYYLILVDSSQKIKFRTQFVVNK